MEPSDVAGDDPPPRRGRPPRGGPMSAAERMRRYRARLRERGLKPANALVPDASLAAIDFSRAPLLTPAERDVLRRFVAALGRLAPMPSSVAVFGSRIRGDAGPESDLDVAVVFDAAPDAATVRAVGRAAERARLPYDDAPLPIALRPVACGRRSDAGFLAAISPERRTVWTRPRVAR
jgi:predicted nucleotidyltransferase